MLLCICLLTCIPAQPSQAAPSFAQNANAAFSIQNFLDQQPGPLKTYRDGDGNHLAATLIESNSLYYGINPYLHLVLLETTSHLLSTPNPPGQSLRSPYTPAGPAGFASQVEWASREIRAGYGPYDTPPVLHFTDGTTITLNLNQAPEGIAIQRFLAIGHTADEWNALNSRFSHVFASYFNSKLPEPSLVAPSGKPLEAPTTGFLQCPWPVGMRVVHLAYFDHAYPTVDSGADGNNVVVTYVGPADVQYNSHDGHDYFFPDVPVGTPILAAAPGIAYARTARGNGVVILHGGGYETVYWHLNSFAPHMRDIIDSSQGKWVDAGDVLGTSGTSGFSYGTPHLHFEVRHYGRQVDPYGWYGNTPDPCPSYAGCVNNGWLWHHDLYGLYDFTPPDYVTSVANTTTQITHDRTPPIGTLSVNPPDSLTFLARYDGHLLQQVGNGHPAQSGPMMYEPGRYGQALALPQESHVSYPISNNLHLEAGTISVWAHIPAEYPQPTSEPHTIVAAYANPDEPQRAGALVLERTPPAADGTARWNFWTNPQVGAAFRNNLTMTDTLTAGWHHMAISWDRTKQTKVLYLDGIRVAATDTAQLPDDVGQALHIGPPTGTRQSGIWLDELAIFNRALPDTAIARIAAAPQPLLTSTPILHETGIVLDTNARDDDGIVVAVQIGKDGIFEDPQPYYDSFRWNLPPVEGEHTIQVRYFDRASNQHMVTETVELNLPPRATVTLVESNDIAATLALSVTDSHQPVDMQISQTADFERALWEPVRASVRWFWYSDDVLVQSNGDNQSARTLYLRFRDASGQVSEPVAVTQ